MLSQVALARAFASLHVSGSPLVLPNAWDVASARVVAAAGAAAVATTSAGVAWAHGSADGNLLPRADAVAAVAAIVRAVEVPVSADIENGLGGPAEEVARTVAAVVEAGAVGINIEDSMRPVAEQVTRLAAARAAAEDAGVPLFVNARIDTHRLGGVGSLAWFDETLDRALAYAEAGASGIFVLGALQADVVRALVAASPVPVNVAFGPGTLSVGELAAAGAHRISAGSSIAEAAYSLVGEMAATMLGDASAAPGPAPTLGWSALNALAE